MSDKLAMLSSTSDAFINDISDELSPSHYSKIETTALSMFFPTKMLYSHNKKCQTMSWV